MAESMGDGEQELRERARKQARGKLDFYKHALVFACVNVFLAALNLLSSPGTLWFYWPLLGWGVALAAHGVAAFYGGGFGAGMYRRMEARELERLREERDGQR